jgi:serine/threonine protein kinase
MTSAQLPESIGRYQILRVLGRGGMGEVYLASDPALGRQVAIKILPAPLQKDAKMRARFLNEARAIAALNHPNVVTIHDMGATDPGDKGFPDSVLYLVIEYVEGLALDEVMDKRRLTVEECLDFGIQVLEGLKLAHQNRILHRDVTPSNLMLTPDRRMKILDFGLSKLLMDGAKDSSKSPRQTGDGMIVGTLDYLSPEQALGNPLDARSDLFSFGIVLYQMLTGVHPFSGESVTQMVARMMTQAAHPWPENPEIPESIRQIVEKALQKDPNDRYASAGEMLLDLMVARRELGGHQRRDLEKLRPPDLPVAAPLTERTGKRRASTAPAPAARPITKTTAEVSGSRPRVSPILVAAVLLVLAAAAVVVFFLVRH